jgi:short-subunit dehydrogenase involved in D-alanine esterification of teichoic acids
MFIKGKTALVTGAATGIGLEYVKALLKNGAQVSYIGQHTRSCNGTGLCTSSYKLPFKGKRVFC